MDNQPEDTEHDARNDDLFNQETYHHGDTTLQSDDATPDDTAIDITRGSTEMLDSEIEPPTGGEDQGDSANTNEEVDDGTDEMLDQPRDEGDAISGVEAVSTGEVLSPDSDVTNTTERTPFHASEIHESPQPQNSAESLDDDGSTEPLLPTTDQPPTEAVPESTIASGAYNLDTLDTEAATTATASVGGVAAASGKSGRWHKKSLMLAAIIAVFVVLLVGGSAVAYKMWYQAPDKVLSDALLNFVKAKSMTYSGTATASTQGDFSANISFSGGLGGDTVSANIDTKLKLNSSTIEIPANIVAQSDTLYFKVSNLKQLESQILSPNVASYMFGPNGQKQIDTFVKSIDGTWYKMTPSDLNESSSDKKTNQCVSDAIDKIRTNHQTQHELMNVYKAHPLYTLQKELGSKNGSLGYELQPVSAQKANQFAKAFKNTSTYKSLVKCNDSLKSMFASDTTAPSDTTTDKESVQIWVSRWSHQITKVTSSSDNSGTQAKFTFVPKVGDDTSITVPSNAKSIDELKKQFTNFEHSMAAQQSAAAQAEANRLQDLHDAQMKAAQGVGTTSNVQAIVE